MSGLTSRAASSSTPAGPERRIWQDDDCGRRAAAYLPTIEVKGLASPVEQMVYQADREIVYAVHTENVIRGDWHGG